MVRKALFWSYVGQLAIFLIIFLGSVLVARILSPREMGVYGVAQAIIGVVQLFSAFSVGTYVIREPQLTEEVIETAFTVNLILNLTLSAIIFLLSYQVARFLAEPAIAVVLQLLAITPLLGIISFLPGTMLQREMAFRGVSIIGALAAAATTGTTVAAAWFGLSYVSPAFGILAGGALSAVGTVWIGRRHVRHRLSVKHWRKIAVFGLRLMSIGGIANAAVRVSEVLIARFLGLEALGVYNRASNLNNLIFSNIYGSATRVIFVQLSEAQHDSNRVRLLFKQGFQMITGVLGPILIGLAVLSGPIVRILYGPRWLETAPLFSLMLCAQFLSLSFSMNWELFVLRGKLRTQTRLEIFRSILGMTTTAVGSMFSLIAVAWSGIIDTVVSIWLYGRYMPRLAGTTPRAILRLYSEALVLAGVAAAPATLAMGSYGWSPDAPVPVLLGAVVLGILAWLLALLYLEHPLACEIRLLIGKHH